MPRKCDNRVFSMTSQASLISAKEQNANVEKCVAVARCWCCLVLRQPCLGMKKKGLTH